MTIAIGFKCLDGVVLCADTQMTSDAGHKFYESKIYSQRHLKCSVCLNYAGYPNVMKAFDEKLHNKIVAVSGEKKFNLQRFTEILEEVLYSVPVLHNEPHSLSGFCAVSVPKEETAMLKIAGITVSPVHASWDYAGVGDSSLLRFLGSLLIPPSLGTTKQALYLGAYLILQAKTFISGCGGSTEAIVLRNDGHMIPRVGMLEDLRKEEAKCMDMHWPLTIMLATATDPSKSEDQFKAALDVFCAQFNIRRPF